jgi:regulatory protein
MSDAPRTPEGARRARRPRPMTRSRLQNIAKHYLERYFTTRAHLRRLLARRVDRALTEHPGDRAEQLGWVDEVLDGLEAAGGLNDAAFAEARARTVSRRGGSERAVRAKLSAKGVDSSEIDAALDALGPRGDRELSAALALARRRRIGPFAADPSSAEARGQKALGILARGGFGYDTARRALTMEPDEAFERLRG